LSLLLIAYHHRIFYSKKNNDNNSSRHIENLFLVLLSLLLSILVAVIVVLFTKIDTLKDEVYKIERENSERHITITNHLANIPKCETKIVTLIVTPESLKKALEAKPPVI
ncbi:MAG: hypothetical protein HQL02_08685, partial [Nitrospirae bacterium]|nr:hypothetical protein [Nitrospirota bacterium]